MTTREPVPGRVSLSEAPGRRRDRRPFVSARPPPAAPPRPTHRRAAAMFLNEGVASTPVDDKPEGCHNRIVPRLWTVARPGGCPRGEGPGRSTPPGPFHAREPAILHHEAGGPM